MSIQLLEEALVLEELTKQVRTEILRTLIWALIATGVGAAIYYLFLI